MIPAPEPDSSPVQPTPALLALGEPMIEFNQTRPGEPQFLQGFGGDTSNAMVAAARQGARSGYVSAVGDDAFGRLLRAMWRSEQVDDTGVSTDTAAPTGIYFVTHDAAGHAFSYRRAGSAASRMTPQSLPARLLRGAKWLHVSAISQAISPSACDAVFAAIELAHDAGVRVSYDPNLRLALWPLARAHAIIAHTMRLLGSDDLFLPGMDEARLLAGAATIDEMVAWAQSHGVRAMVGKSGADGCIVVDGTDRERIAPHKVDAVDATGAGDCFNGALLARLVAGDRLVDAARYANAAAALATTGFGAVQPIPRPQQVRALLTAAD